MQLSGKVIALTGAGGGLGRQLACELALRGAAVSLCDLRLTGVEETARLVRRAGGTATPYRVDVTDRMQVHDWANKTSLEHGVVDVLINNAGITLPWRLIDEVPYEHLRAVVDVNLWGAIHGTLAFLPVLRLRPESAIVTIASIGSLAALSRQIGYCTSKFAVRGFVEGLRMELAGTNTHCMLVMPGRVRGTQIMKKALGMTTEEATAVARLEGLPVATPLDRAARYIASGIEHDKARVLVGMDARLMAGLVRLCPAHYTTLLKPLAARLSKARDA